MARPTKLDDLRAKRIVDALRDGHSFAGAARAGGITEGTLADWRQRGADGDAEFSGFSRRVNEASQEAENRAVQVLKGSMLQSDDLKLATDTAWKWLRARRAVEWLEPKTATAEDASRTDGEDLSIDVLESVLAAAKSRKAG